MDKLKFQNEIFASILSMLLILSVLPLVSSADLATTDVTLYIPQLERDNVINGTVQVNISIADAFADQNWTRAIVYITGGGATANSSLVVLNNSPDNINQSRQNNSLIFITDIIEDGNDYTLTFTLWNGTNRLNVTKANVQVNNSVPNAPSIWDTITQTNSSTFNFTATVNNSATTACFLNFTGTNPSSPSYTMGYSGGECSRTLTNIPNGEYLGYVTASDGNDGTTVASKVVKINVFKGSAVGIIASESKTKTNVLGNVQGKARGLVNALQNASKNAVGVLQNLISKLTAMWS